ncbi:hypothetical protein [Thaumasiovibrio subtropicus]|uniref:hypothetical protein n=1 Tax=Thaumasiovibrio subtropicus TaxID=1891207 RepID=UPI000B34FADB|nr:hypothetical protein [Thaumasiovibrio subtropicus]
MEMFTRSIETLIADLKKRVTHVLVQDDNGRHAGEIGETCYQMAKKLEAIQDDKGAKMFLEFAYEYRNRQLLSGIVGEDLVTSHTADLHNFLVLIEHEGFDVGKVIEQAEKIADE